LSPRRERGPELPPAAEIDRLYGLEPVIEPAGADEGAGLGEFVVVTCPYCAESYETPIDLTAGPVTQIEDCQVCCQPIELETRLTDEGALDTLLVRRLD
jgi:hypothetical protein